MTAVERFLNTARSQLGYIGHKSNYDLDNPTSNTGGKYNKYARDIDKTDIMNGPKQGYDWCACFVIWCLYTTFGIDTFRAMTGIPARSAAAGVKYLAQYFKNIGQFFTTPQPGDLICYKNGQYWQHVGIVEKVENGYIYTIEGNAGTPSGVHRFINRLTNISVWGYCRPKWEVVPVETIPDQPAQPAQPVQPEPQPDSGGAAVQDSNGESDEMLTYEKWKEYMERYRKELQAKEGSSWSADARNWAIATGLFSGADSGYMWQDFLTREQAATLFMKRG